MDRLAYSRPGRDALHLLALSRDGALRFHAAGIWREMSPAESFDRSLPLIVVLSVMGFSFACFRMLTGA